jgi:flagellar hook-associated protein 3 FlgL
MYGIYSTSEQFLTALELLHLRQSRVQNQITSGIRVSKPSDAPTAVSDVLTLTARIGNTSQVKSNLSRVQTETDTAELSLQSAVQLLEKGISFAAQGASSLAGTSQRAILARQVDALLEQMVGMSRAQVAGQYIFSGDQDSQPSYVVNLESETGVDRLIQPSATRLIQDTSGVTFSAAETAQVIFDHRNADGSIANDNVFSALYQLRTALLADNTEGIAAAAGTMKLAQNRLNEHLGFYGAVQNRIRNAMEIADTYQIQQQGALGSLRDTDIAAAALESVQVQTNLNAAMASKARLQLGSLFDYLK